MNEQVLQIITQGLGIIAFVITALSFQCKKLNKVMMMQIISCSIWTIHFYLAGGYAAALINAIYVVRSIVYAFVKNKKAIWTSTVLLSLAAVAAAIVTVAVPFFNELWFIALITASASVVGNVFLAINNDRTFRYVQLFFISPCWMFNNIWYRSIGGILCEIFNVISVIVSLIRFHRKKNEIAIVKNITMDIAKDIFLTNDDFIIVDVRREDEYSEGHIPNSINYPNENITDKKLDIFPDLNKKIYVYCRSGRRSQMAAEKLVKIGYKDVTNAGGIIDYKGEITK